MPAIFHKLLIVIVLVGACFGFWNNGSHVVKDDDVTGHIQAADQISAEREMPDYNGSPYLIVNNNVPFFTDKELQKNYGTVELSPLDSLGRPHGNFMIVGPETLPHQKRGPIGMVKPAGWQTVKYDFIEGKYLYNRSHLLGYQLSGFNAEKRNLITGTEYFNKKLMLPYENKVAAVAKRGKHMAYRVTPVYRGSELVARGVLMEGYSLEDKGLTSFNVFVYNIEPGVVIDYATGHSQASGDMSDNRDSKAIEKSIERHWAKTRKAS